MDAASPRPPLTGHVGALDGLRGAAVAAVLVFHGGHLRGGYLGVDLFFTLSGFLITSLLLREVTATGRVDLRAFWTRRARRLLPAVFGLLVGVAVFVAAWVPAGQRAAVRGDATATLLYVANWRALLGGNGYWDQYALPSPLQHTWSLAVEEQFYLVWPLVVVGVLALAARRSLVPARAIAVVAGVGALASYGAMAVLHDPGHAADRPYLGTDTRVGAILVGAALAALLAGRSAPDPALSGARRWKRARVELAALAGAAWLAWAWTSLDGQSTLLYRGGFVLCAVAAVAIVTAAVHPHRGVVARTLELAPLRGLGLISYGLYLWHWPIFLALRIEGRRLGLEGWWLFAAQVTVSVAVAVVSYRLIEHGIRLRGLGAWGRRGPWLAPAAAALAVIVVVAVTTVGAQRTPERVTTAAAFEPLPVVTAAERTRTDVPRWHAPPPTATPTTAAPTTAAAPTTTAPQRAAGPVPRPPGRDPRLLVVGDSVGMDFAAGLEDPSLRLHVVDRASPGCKVNQQPHRWRAGGVEQETIEARECVGQWDLWREAVSGFAPDAVLVVFGSGLHGEVELDGSWVDVCSARFADAWRADTEAAIDVLAAGGATVHVALPADTTSVFVPEGLLEGTACVREIYRAAVANRAAVARVVPLDTWVCPTGGDCRLDVDGVTLREDGTHFQGGGRAKAAAWMASQLFLPA